MTKDLKPEHYERIKADVEYWREEIWACLDLTKYPSHLVFDALEAMEKVEAEYKKWIEWKERKLMRMKAELEQMEGVDDYYDDPENEDGQD